MANLGGLGNFKRRRWRNDNLTRTQICSFNRIVNLETAIRSVVNFVTIREIDAP